MSIIKNIKSLKLLISTKTFFAFLAFYILGNYFLFTKYTYALWLFSVTEKTILLSEVNFQKIHPINLLIDKFTCSIPTLVTACSSYWYVLLFIVILLEGFTVYTIIRSRKLSKKILIPYCIILQLFLIVPFSLVTFSPTVVFNHLSKQANKEISNAIQILNNHDKRIKNNIYDDVVQIQKKIDDQEQIPLILEDSPQERAVFQVLHIYEKQKDTIFRSAIIPFQVYYSPEIKQEKEKIHFQILLFPNNSLVIQKVNKDSIDKLVPVLAQKLIKSELSQYLKSISVLPIFTVLDENEYLTIRNLEKEKAKQQLLSYIEEIKSNITLNQTALSQNENNISIINSEYNRYKAYSEEWVRNCKKNFGDNKCKEGEETIASELAKLQKKKEENSKANKIIEENIKIAQNYLSIAQKNYENFIKNPILPENEEGVFVPPDKIHLKFALGHAQPFSYFLTTGLHEYLHYVSYQTGFRRSSLLSFLEEGITDYLAGKIMYKHFQKQFLYGYPDEVEIVEKIVKLDSKDKIIDTYFSKSDKELEEFIDSKLERGTYETLKTKGELLSFTSSQSDKKEALKKEIIQLLSPSTSN